MYPPHDLGGGYEITWRSSVEFLRARGDAVRVLVSDFRAPGVDAGREPGVRRDLRWYWRDHAFLRLGGRERRTLERWNESVLDEEIAAFRPDAIAWWSMGGMSLSLVGQAARAGVPAIGVVGDYWMEYGPKLTRTPRRRIDLSAPLWLFNSEHTRRLSLATGLDLPRTAVAHPGLDDELFTPVAPRDDWAGRLLYVGRLDERKGVHVAADALERLPGTTLTIQGHGDRDYTQTLRRDGVVLSHWARTALPGVYAAADAVVFPVQWAEPWGLVPLEAMAVGRPVVATGTGGSAEYLRHEENCVVYEPAESPDALAAAVERLAGDPALRERLRAGGLQTAARFTERSYNQAITAALHEVTAA
jgi:glycogen(starch) synthase